MTELVDRADALLASGRDADAVALVRAAADRGDPDALFRQGLWRLMGRPLARDLPEARLLFHRAGDAGHIEARRFEIALVANGSGGPDDFAAARRLLDRATDGDPAIAAQRDLLAAMALDADGRPTRPPRSEPLVASGAIVSLPGFATPAECAHIARSVGDILAPATVVDPRTGRSVPHPVRTSHAAVIGPTREDLAIRAINHRLAAASGTATDQGEALTVLHYAPGQQFRLHSDAIPGARNQRIATILIYLNDGFDGGETTFPDHGIIVTPCAGDALLFHNVLADGSPDSAMQHSGEPVRRGTKWLATRWIRARAFSPWDGPEA